MSNTNYEDAVRHELNAAVRHLDNLRTKIELGHRAKGINKKALRRAAHMAHGKYLGFAQVGLVQFTDPALLDLKRSIRRALEVADGHEPATAMLVHSDRVRGVNADGSEGSEGTVTLVEGGKARVEFDDGSVGVYNQVNDPRVVRL